MKNEGECLRSAFAPVPSPVLTRGSEPKATNDKGGPAQRFEQPCRADGNCITDGCGIQG